MAYVVFFGVVSAAAICTAIVVWLMLSAPRVQDCRGCDKCRPKSFPSPTSQMASKAKLREPQTANSIEKTRIFVGSSGSAEWN